VDPCSRAPPYGGKVSNIEHFVNFNFKIATVVGKKILFLNFNVSEVRMPTYATW
jgi:hypothetical protein